MRKIFDGEELFRVWCGWGAAASNNRLIDYAKEKYGQASQMGPRNAMWKWAFDHPEEAYPIYKEFFFQKYPELPQPTFEDFLKEAMRLNLNSGAKEVQRFAAKYDLEVGKYNFRPGDVAQVVRRSNPLFQCLVIIERADGESIDAYLTNDNGTHIVHSFLASELAIVGKAPYGERGSNFIIAQMTKVPKLETLAKQNETPLISIEFPRPGDMGRGITFIYSYYDEGERQYEQRSYDNFDTGLDAEIKRLQNIEVSA